MSELKLISPHLRQLVASSNGSGNGTPPTDAAKAAAKLLGCYRRDDAADPETYATAVAAVLSMYSPDIVRRVTDPRTGLAGRSKWLPTVSEVREACEEIVKGEAAARKREADLKAQIERRAEMPRAERPTYDDLLAKHGPDFGVNRSADVIRDMIGEESAKPAKPIDHNAMFKRECAAAGIDPAKGVSPALIAAIHKREHVA